MGHIHFEDSDNEGMGDAGPSVAAAAPAPAIASAPTGPAGQLKTPVCCGSARVDFNFNDPCYVFRALPNPATGMVAASVSNNTIKLYQNSGPQLSLVGELRGHTGRITDLAFPGPSTSGGPANLVMSSSADGTVVAWDTRTGQPAERWGITARAVPSQCFEATQIVDTSHGEGWVRLGGMRETSNPCSPASLHQPERRNASLLTIMTRRGTLSLGHETRYYTGGCLRARPNAYQSPSVTSPHPRTHSVSLPLSSPGSSFAGRRCCPSACWSTWWGRAARGRWCSGTAVRQAVRRAAGGTARCWGGWTTRTRRTSRRWG